MSDTIEGLKRCSKCNTQSPKLNFIKVDWGKMACEVNS